MSVPPALSAWVEFFDDGSECAFFDVGVDLGGGDVCVAEEFLDDSEVRTAPEEVCGEAMAQEVWMHVRFKSGAGCVLVQQLADAGGGEFFSTDGEKDFAAGFF